MKKSELTRVLVVLLPAAVLCFAPLRMWASGNDDQWQALAKIDHNATCTFVDRNHSCVDGKIGRIDDQSVTIKHHADPETTIERTNLLRVTSGGWAGGVIYSGRSSWLDIVRISGRRFHPEITVVMKSGEAHEGKLLSASDSALVVERSRKQLNILKDEVSTVSYVRAKPLSDSAEYADDELAWMKIFDPQLWPHLMHLQGRLSILLYDVSVPEDNSPIVCKPGSDLTHPAP
jgi:hypothetical protein